MYTCIFVIGKGLEAIDQGVEAAKTSYAEARESRKRLQAAERQHLAKVSVAEGARAVYGLQQRLKTSTIMSGTNVKIVAIVLHTFCACVQRWTD